MKGATPGFGRPWVMAFPQDCPVPPSRSGRPWREPPGFRAAAPANRPESAETGQCTSYSDTFPGFRRPRPHQAPGGPSSGLKSR